MNDIYVIYWSQSGNTKAMAEGVAQGITEAGKTAKVLEVSEANADDLKDAKAFALGSPATGVEEVEESEMQPFVEELEDYLKGKHIALFGSYGWGGGEYMRNWESRLVDSGANIVGEEGVVCLESPDDRTIEECKQLGAKLAELA